MATNNLKFLNFIQANNYIRKYILNILLLNFLSFIFLNNTTSFNTGLISVTSIVVSINNFFYFIYVIIETISSYFDTYDLNYNFTEIITYSLKFQNISFIFYIIFENLNYILFLITNICFLIYQKKILNIKFLKIIKKVKFQIFILSGALILMIFYHTYNYPKIMMKRLIDKLNFYHANNNILRIDNFYLVYKINNKYNKNNLLKEKFLFSEKFKQFNNINNIYVIINESYPNFKAKYYKNKLEQSLLGNIKENFTITRYKKNWSKSYSTQGAELNFFCDDNLNFTDFKNKSLNLFILQENCWVQKLNKYNKIFIHSYNRSSFNRTRYKSFFNQTFFLEDLKKFNYELCPGIYSGICDDEIINKFLLNIKKNNKKNFTIFLTLNNHIPQKETYDEECNKFPLTLNAQFCTLYINQKKFNISVNMFLKKLKKNDLVIFFSDTPPMYSLRDRKHFEDYVDVFFIKKDN